MSVTHQVAWKYFHAQVPTPGKFPQGSQKLDDCRQHQNEQKEPPFEQAPLIIQKFTVL